MPLTGPNLMPWKINNKTSAAKDQPLQQHPASEISQTLYKMNSGSKYLSGWGLLLYLFYRWANWGLHILQNQVPPAWLMSHFCESGLGVTEPGTELGREPRAVTQGYSSIHQATFIPIVAPYESGSNLSLDQQEPKALVASALTPRNVHFIKSLQKPNPTL